MIESIYQWLVDTHLQSPYMLKVLLSGVLVSSVCGVIGCFIILRRMAFLGDALAHSMLAGVVCGYLMMKVVFGVDAHGPAMLIGSIIAGLITSGMISLISKTSRIKEDAAIGIMYTGIFAVGGILASLYSDRIHIDLYHFITGQVLAVEDSALWMMAIVAAIVLSVVILFFRQLQLTSFDPVMAASIGISAVAFEYLLTACTSLVVVSAVNIVGVVLVVGLLVTPAATAYLLCDRLSRMLWVSALFGISSFMFGYYLSERLDVAPGSAIVLSGVIQFLVVLTFAPRYGWLADWLRRRRAVPQRLVEDILLSIFRAPQSTLAKAEIPNRVDGIGQKIQRGIRSLAKRGWIAASGDQMLLTTTGRREARRLLRAHRLWETYLEHVGTPAEQLHQQADRLEHVHDEATVDYLDDKLGHPLRDPHGAEIPEDFVDLETDAFKAALLRKGHRAEVIHVEPAAQHTPLQPGMTITVGDRQEDDRLWSFLLPNGEEVLLDHHGVDAVYVRLEKVDT